MERENDTRSKRTKALTVDDPRAEQLRQAFKSAPTMVNGRQALAIHELLTTGKQGGADHPPADPIPQNLVVTGVGKRAPDPLWDATADDPDPSDGVGREYQGLAVLAEDGRMWSCTGAGICWPGGTSFREARRGH
jgi:hypothetical protein